MASERSEPDSGQCPMCPVGTLQSAPAGAATTLTLERGGATIVFKDVPASVCDTCGEAFVDEDVSEELHEQTEAALEAGAEVDVRRYGVRPTATSP